MTGLERLLEYTTSLKYPRLVNHLEKVYLLRKDEWAICAWTNLPTDGANTSNYLEIIFKVTEDLQFNRSKTFLGHPLTV